MKQLKNKYLILAISLVAFLASCKKDNQAPIELPAVRQGIYILSEGPFNGNNASLTYYDFAAKTTVPDIFKQANSRGLGDTGNDIQVYGSKMYIIVNVSSTLEIVNAKTAVSIKKIDFKDGAKARQPRYIVFNKNKAYISSYDGTVAVLDTATMAIEKYITVGRNPEKMAIANGKLYVANSGGLDYPNYDKTVSVIDLATNTETKKITVVVNPRGVFADAYGDVYVLSTGDYGAIKASMAIIDSKTDAIKAQGDFSAGSVAINGDLAYMTGSGGVIKVFNLKTDPIVGGVYTLEKANFITDNTKATTASGLAWDKLNEQLYVLDAKNYTSNGEALVYDKTGTKINTIATGVIPTAVAFLNK